MHDIIAYTTFSPRERFVKINESFGFLYLIFRIPVVSMPKPLNIPSKELSRPANVQTE